MRYIVAVAEHQHFGKAAESCHITQPTLSMQIKKCERTLGVPLFERDQKKVIITPAGKAIIDRAKIILQEQKAIEHIAEEFKNPFAGSITLGAFPTLAPYLLPKILPKISKGLPKVKIFLIEEKTQTLIKYLENGTIDAAFLALPVDINNAMVTPFMTEDFYLAVPQQHAFAHKKNVAMKELENEKLLLLEEGHCLRDQVLDACTMVGAKENNEFRATSLETLRYMVRAGSGITLMPNLARDPKDKLIAYIPFKKPKPRRTIALCWRASTPKKAALMEILTIANKIKI